MVDSIAVKDASGATITLETSEKGLDDLQAALLAGSLKVVGPVADGAAASGAPVPVGGKVGIASPNESVGDRVEFRMGVQGSLLINLRDDILGLSASVVTFGGDGVSAGAHGGLVTAARPQYLNAAGTFDRGRGDASGQLVQQYGLSASRFQYAGVTGGITNTSDVALAAAPGATLRNFLTGIQYQNTSAIASEIVVKDGSTVIWRGVASAAMTQPVSITFPAPLKGSLNTALNVAMITTATATVVSAQGYTGV